MNWQYIIVGIVFILAVFYIAKTMFKSAKGKSHCAEGDCGCSSGKITENPKIHSVK